MQAFQSWLAQTLTQLGYVEIFWLMALESSLFPVPSELVMIPAGYLAQRGGLDPVLAILAGGAGSLLGASGNYLLGRYVGRAFLLRYGRYLLINADKYQEAEALFLRNAYVSTFIGRLLPVIRHLISLPAGIFAMQPLAFAAITFVGATLWSAILVAAGYYLGEPAVKLFQTYTHELTLAVVALLALGVAWFLLRRR